MARGRAACWLLGLLALSLGASHGFRHRGPRGLGLGPQLQQVSSATPTPHALML